MKEDQPKFHEQKVHIHRKPVPTVVFQSKTMISWGFSLFISHIILSSTHNNCTDL